MSPQSPESQQPQEPALSPEDAKLVTLARATRARAQAAQGAAVRDLDGRTYAAASLDLQALRLSALQGCIAMAVSSAARGVAAAVVLADASELAEADRAVLEEFAGPDVVVHLGDARGTILA